MSQFCFLEIREVIRSFSFCKMPNKARCHEECRGVICLICFQKELKNIRMIKDETLERVQKYFIVDYDPADPKLPNGICGKCRKLLLEVI